MVDDTQFKVFTCPTEEISAYIDGELTGARELELDAHFSVCEHCTRELNLQKQFLCGLNSTLKHEGDLDLPADFTKLIVANAESTVAGLRRPRERYNAIFICAGLFFFALFAVGAEAGRLFEGVYVAFDQAGAVGGFFGHLVYSFFVGVAIVLRSLAGQFGGDAVAALALTAVIAAFLMLLSRKVLRMRRV